MSIFCEIIVYIWLLPLAAHILLPLAILVAWSAKKLLSGKGGRAEMKKKPAVSL